MQIPEEFVSAVDIPQLAETFADSIGALAFDGQTLRIEFCVTRLDAVSPNKPPSGKRYPSCRMVLTSTAAMTLAHQLHELVLQLQKQGILASLPSDGTARH